MFVLRKIIGAFLSPLAVCFFLLVIGGLILWVGKRKKAGRAFVLMGLALLAGISFPPLPNALVGSLEDRYPPLNQAALHKKVGFIVVLGGGHTSDKTRPATAWLSPSSLVRLVEGLRIHRRIPGSKVVLSGGGVFDPIPNAEVMKRVALALGANERDLMLEIRSRNTREEAVEVRRIVDSAPFILVTSAFHMPRAMYLFHEAGLKPIPAPTDYKSKKGGLFQPASFFPSAGAIQKAEIAVHECLGLAWILMSGGYNRRR